jgi:hypothetical protein
MTDNPCQRSAAALISDSLATAAASTCMIELAVEGVENLLLKLLDLSFEDGVVAGSTKLRARARSPSSSHSRLVNHRRPVNKHRSCAHPVLFSPGTLTAGSPAWIGSSQRQHTVGRGAGWCTVSKGREVIGAQSRPGCVRPHEVPVCLADSDSKSAAGTG